MALTVQEAIEMLIGLIQLGSTPAVAFLNLITHAVET
jgi:hypothetical protein